MMDARIKSGHDELLYFTPTHCRHVGQRWISGGILWFTSLSPRSGEHDQANKGKRAQ
jgi:hypothetical protein